jgi:photosystem II stability/assembly factor-like uncharacterized protein
MKLRYIFLFLLTLNTAFSQEIPPLADAQSLHEHEEQFRNWLENNPTKKGWKWMARYEHDLLRRIDSDGKMPSNEVLMNSFQEIQSIQSANARQKATPEWSPAGPYGDPSLYGIGRINCIAFHPKDSLTFYIGFGQGGIWKTTDGGKNYIPIGDKLPILRISAIAIDPINPETLYISLADFAYIGYDLYTADRKRNTYYGIGIWKSTDGGRNWQQTGLKNNLEEGINSINRTIWINPKNTRELVTCGTKGVFKSTNGGDSWNLVLDKISSSIVQDPVNSNILMATGVYVATTRTGESGIWRSEDAGNTWRLITTGILTTRVQRTEIAHSRTEPNIVYAVTCNLNNGFEGFYRSSDGGLTWNKSVFTGNILSTSFTASGGQGFYDLCIMVHPTDSKKVYVGGLIIAETSDAGNTWRFATSYSSIHPDQHYLTYNPLNKTIYLCNDGGLYSTKQIIPNTSVNQSWKFISNGVNATSCYRLGVSEDGKRILTGAQDNGMYLSKPNTPWSSEFGGDGMEGALVDNWVYGSSQFGYITFFDANDPNKSEKWVFPPSSYSDTGEWTTPFVINKEQGLVTIAGGNVHRVKIGSDNNLLNPLSNFIPNPNTRRPTLSTALAVPKSNPNTIYVFKKNTPLIKEKSQFYRTLDAGKTWEFYDSDLYSDSYITYLIVDDKNPDRLWATLSNFTAGRKILYSSDGGKTWENITYNLPNLPANSVVYQSDEKTNILYAAMDIGVYYLIEGSNEWKPLMGNLPNVIVHELEINYTTKKLYAATFGRGIWITDLLTETLPSANSIYEAEVIVYPNPAKGDVFVKADYSEVEKIQIVDVLGRIVHEEELKPKALRFGKKLDLNENLKGLFYIRLIQGDKSKVVRLWRE